MQIGPEVVNGDMTSTIAWAIGGLARAGDSVDLYGVIITARFGYEYDVDGDVVPSAKVQEHVKLKLEARRA